MASENAFSRQARSTTGFIRSYGLFWDAPEIEWGRVGADLLGRRNNNNPALQVADFWDQRGIYVLYNDYGPYYVGRTKDGNTGLGKRLSDHATGSNNSPHVGRWDRFSWFGWRGVLTAVDYRGIHSLRKVPKHLLTDSTSTVGDIEALLIHALGTIHVGNRREESFAAALKWEQIRREERELYLDRIAP